MGGTLIDRAVVLGRWLLVVSSDSSLGFDVFSGCRSSMARTYTIKVDQLVILVGLDKPGGWYGWMDREILGLSSHFSTDDRPNMNILERLANTIALKSP
ncbi:hypothetical protein TanjilG_10622 [Lupinus angustifolius]|uniref:Uncharacterized protein n=1 Tax=Lupinus angustifolius TaxID=3871 RepID=A0A4P1RW11_LUPAN|nr:hypothetical protein TanjilG_10622 [Lupinus angustifolius]